MMSVTQPLHDALRRTTHICITTFRFQKWVALTLCAWLVGLGDASLNVHPRLRSTPHTNVSDLERLLDAGRDHPTATVAILAALFLIGVGIAAVLAWIKSRAEFALIDNLAHNRGDIPTPWRDYRHEANSLFKTRLLLGACFIVAGLLLAGALAGAWVVWGASVSAWVGLVVSLPLTVAWLAAWSLGEFVLEQLLVPMMYARRIGVREAWTNLRALAREGRSGVLVTYFVMSWLVVLMAASIASMVGWATCCVGALPLISTALLLPVLIYLRCYALAFVEQFGPEYRIFDREAFSGR